jgi:uncharacterized repeat protein (TIGR03803 family)
MTSTVQPSCKRWRLRAASVALALAAVLLPELVATRSAQAQTFTTLYNFTGPPDAKNPAGGLVQDAAGNLYGAGSGGNSSACGGCGAVFKLTPGGTETVLYSFTGPPDGAGPNGGLILDAAGNLYGTTQAGGNSSACSGGCGTIFKLDPTGKETVLHSFDGADGSLPNGYLIQDASGNLYGTTQIGGSGNSGVVFKLDPTGTLTVLYDFMGGADGGSPQGGLVQDAAGNLYGVSSGGTVYGSVFKVDQTGTETVLFYFNGSDGWQPGGGLVLDSSGALYGTTLIGGVLSNECKFGCGVVFKLDTSGTETVLYSFTGPPDGYEPTGTLVRDAAGDLYGNTVEGGSTVGGGHGCGTVYKLDTTGKESVLYSFINAFPINSGLEPSGSLIQDAAGNLYGTTLFDGTATDGIVFKLGSLSPANFGLFVGLSGSGTGGVISNAEIDNIPYIDCTNDSADNACSAYLATGTALTLTATPSASSNFSGWSGACSGTGTCSLTMNADQSVTASFDATTPPGFSLSPASASLTLQPGGQVTDVITVAPQNGAFTSAIQLSCKVVGAAPAPTCSLSPSSAIPGANSVSSTLTITAATAATLAPSRNPTRLLSATPLLIALLGITLLAASRKERRTHFALFGFLVLILLQSACGNSSGGSGTKTQPTNYTVTVTGVSASITETAQISVTVQ